MRTKIDIQNTPYTQIAEILYPEFLTEQINRRNEAIELLNKKEFRKLRSEYVHYCNSDLITAELNSLAISDIAKQLSEFKQPENAEPAYLASFVSEDTDFYFNSKIVIEYRQYSISDESKCESLAKHWSKDAAWKLKHQPSGKDGIAALKKLNRILSKED